MVIFRVQISALMWVTTFQRWLTRSATCHTPFQMWLTSLNNVDDPVTNVGNPVTNVVLHVIRLCERNEVEGSNFMRFT